MDPAAVDEVLMGNVCSANIGQVRSSHHNCKCHHQQQHLMQLIVTARNNAQGYMKVLARFGIEVFKHHAPHYTISSRLPPFADACCCCLYMQAPATQAALKAGIPSSVPCTLINKVCSSGMKAVVLGAQTILAGESTPDNCDLLSKVAVRQA